MQNHFLIETEVAHRRYEWERAVVESAQAARAGPEHGGTSWWHRPHVVLERLRSLAPAWPPVTSAWKTSAPGPVTWLAGRCGAVTRPADCSVGA